MGAGGSLTLSAGKTTAASAGGAVTINAGETAGAAAGGAVTITSGTSTSTGDTGAVTLASADDTGNGASGDMTLSTGMTVAGNSGALSVVTGTATGRVFAAFCENDAVGAMAAQELSRTGRRGGIGGLLGLGFGGLEQLGPGLLEPQSGIRALDLGLLGQYGIDALCDKFRPASACADQVHGQLVAIFQHGFQNVCGRQNLMPIGQSGRLCTLNNGPGAFSILLNIHLYPL